MIRRGINCPNRAWERWIDVEIRALWDLAPETLLILGYGPGIYVQRENRRIVHEYLAARPDTRVLLRPYADAIPTYEPRRWAQECYARFAWWGIPEAELIPANEINLAGEHGPMTEHGTPDWNKQVEWLKAFAEAWRKLWPHNQLHLPALSPSPDRGHYNGWIIYRAAGLHQMYDVVDVHAYGSTAVAEVRTAAAFWGKPISVTEFNQIAPAMFFEGIVDVARDGCYYILSGTEEWRQYWLTALPVYYESFKWRIAPRAGGNVDAQLAKTIIEHLDIIYGYNRNEVSKVATAAKSANLSEAANAIEERTLAIKRLVEPFAPKA